MINRWGFFDNSCRTALFGLELAKTPTRSPNLEV